MWKYLALRKFGAVCIETWLLVGCVLGSYYVRLQEFPFSPGSSSQIFWKALIFSLIFQIFLHLNDIYDFRGTRITKNYLARLCKGLLISTVCLSVLFNFVPFLKMERVVFVLSLIFGTVFIVIWHAILRMYFGRRTPKTNVVVLGTGPQSREAVKEILKRPELGIRVVGFVDDNPRLMGVSIVNPKVIGTYQDLPKLVAGEKVDRIIVGLQDRRGKLPIKNLLDFKTKGVGIEEVATFYERVAGKIPIENLKPSWMVFNPGFTVSKRLLIEKRILSVVASSLLLLLFLPLMLLLMVLIKLDSKGPVLYKQERVGQDGQTFMLCKFRSMVADAESKTGPVWSTGAKDDPRVTRIGKFLRKLRLDELPQLFNVLRGDMSFVGPRPERPYFVQQLSETIPFYSLRHVVKPGITGWAQINYGYANSLDHTIEKLQYDLFYIKNMSWLLDSMIMFETVKTVLVREGS